MIRPAVVRPAPAVPPALPRPAPAIPPIILIISGLILVAVMIILIVREIW
jgi:hypothetical protein